MNQSPFISFETSQQGIRATLSMQGIINIEGDVESVINQATEIYKSALNEMKDLLFKREGLQKDRIRIPARLIWQIGDAIFRLNDDLLKIDLQIDNTYYHLVRDLGVNRKWLEKVVIFRRYIQHKELIPETATWGSFEKGTRKKVQLLIQGK
jgi:hypothetical protein